MKNIPIVFLSLILVGCGKISDIDTKSFHNYDAFVILDTEFVLDGEELEICSINVNLDKSPDGVKVVGHDSPRFKIISVPNGGEVYFDSAFCNGGSYLLPKSRRKEITPNLVVKVEQGTVTYPGTILVDWESEGFGVLDVVIGLGAISEDKGSFVMKRTDHSKKIQSKLRRENYFLTRKFKFVTVKFEDNKNIIQ